MKKSALRHVVHINATPEFLANKKSMKMLEKMVGLAYKQTKKKKKK